MSRIAPTPQRPLAIRFALRRLGPWASLSLLFTSLGAAPDSSTFRQRVQELPKAQRPAWTQYLGHSELLYDADEHNAEKELRDLGLKDPIPSPERHSFGVDRKLPVAWYATEEGRQLADNVLSYQLPSGGWSKNVNMAAGPRPAGGAFGPDDETGAVATFDNNATLSQIRILALAATATGEAKYRDGCQRGIQLVLMAQYPNGGWPQYFPLHGGYHDAITYNDGAIANILRELREIAQGREPYAFVPADTQAAAAQAFERGVQNLIAAAIRIDGKAVGWGQQHDAFSLAPTNARKFEPASYTTAETAGLLDFLMTLEDPSPETVALVHEVAAWLDKLRIPGKTWSRQTGMADDPASPGIWSRMYDLTTWQPIFGDRDGTIHTDLTEISLERQRGYAWYVTSPLDMLKRYAKWSKKFPAPTSAEPATAS